MPPPVKPKKNIGTIVSKRVAAALQTGKKDTLKEIKDKENTKETKKGKYGMQQVKKFMMAVNPNQKQAHQAKMSEI
jgi:hypothetical protein